MLGVLHVHSENSLKKSALCIKDILSKAKSLGYEAVALTDTGSMTGIAEFIMEAERQQVKPVPGVELLVKEETGGVCSLVLMAKDYTGYVGLCKAVSQANKTILGDNPVLPVGDLVRLFAPPSPYHGRVIATSGGEDGVLSGSAYYHEEQAEKEHVLLEHLAGIKVEIGNGKGVQDELLKAEEEILSYQSEKKTLSGLAKKCFTKKEERLNALEGQEGYYSYKAELDAEKQASLDAGKRLKSISDKITRRKKKIQTLQTEAARLEKLRKNMETLEAELLKIKSPEQPDYIPVQEKIRFYKGIFGPDFYIELMFHGRRKEAIVMPALADAAVKNGIPTVLSNDVHILEATSQEILKYQVICSLKNNEWVPDDPSVRHMSLLGKEELFRSMEGLIDTEILVASFENMERIFDSCSFSWPKEKHYPKYMDEQGRDAKTVLEEKVRGNIPKLYKDGEWGEEHERNLQYQLKVTQDTGYSDYSLIISDILEEGRKGCHDGIQGAYIGPGRGSGAGSLVNYLLGITQIDPMKYGLIFERYLNIERISPPDIDSDVATSIRDSLVKYITKRYSTSGGGKVGVCSILTKSRLTARAAVRAAGRVISSRIYGNAATLYHVADAISKTIPANSKLGDCQQLLEERFTGAEEQEIISCAMLIEGALSGYGTHAAGVIISDNGDVTDYAPIINLGTNEEPVWNIQYDMYESEQIGLLKMDILGLTTLDIITGTCRRVYESTGIMLDMASIPFEKQVFKSIYASGDTIGVFQCESSGMQQMWKRLKPDCIDDIIAGIALYRPGPMDFIPDYIKGKHQPGSIKYITPQLEPILSDTYGTIIYQEQVMRIVRDLAGYSMGRSDLVRRAMSKKKEAIMEAERKNFVYGNEAEGIRGCIKNGIRESDAHKIYDTMIDFAKYAFNRSHAAAYAVVSYQTAWLKYHYPKEFLAETMNILEQEKLPLYLKVCREHGIQVDGPDINYSAYGFRVKGERILYGISNVKSVKKNAKDIIGERDKNGPFLSFQDFIFRTKANRTAVCSLIQAGAFDKFCKSRTGLLELYESVEKRLKRVNLLSERIKKECLEYKKDGLSMKEKNRLQEAIDRDGKEISEIRKQIESIVMPHDKKDDPIQKLEVEKGLLGAYVSAHPIDFYESSLAGMSPIQSVDSVADVKLAGMVVSLRVLEEKEMAVFTLEDRTGQIRTIVGKKAFLKYRNVLKEGKIIKVYGHTKVDSGDTDQFVLFASYLSDAVSGLPQVLFQKDDFYENEAVNPKIQPFINAQGHQVLLFDKKTGGLSLTKYFVTDEVFGSGVACRPVKKYIA